MNKRTYRSKNVNKINWSQVKNHLSGAAVVFSLDVAKTKQYALLTNSEGTVSEGLWWNHPEQVTVRVKMKRAEVLKMPELKRRLQYLLLVYEMSAVKT